MSSGLFTDYYELTMAQGYLLAGRAEEPAVFDYFFRSCPFDGSFVVSAGLWSLIEELENLSFSGEEIHFLERQGFAPEFLQYLRNFTFRGDLFAVQEGEIVFPLEPVLRIEGTLLEAQLVETLVLNSINFQSLIATKAARIALSAGGKPFMDFGLRRSQGWGGLHASRAAVIGGASATSNVLAGFRFDLPVAGTQAHSWIQSFPDEKTAFREFARIYPDNCVFLVDTFDTLSRGIPNAIDVAREMEKQGHRLKGIRLDSGDLTSLSRAARQLLDDAGLSYVQILASDGLDEYSIQELLKADAPIDGFGIGTQMITGQPSAALNGVYKLCALNGVPRIKFSDDFDKTTLPGAKKI